MPSPLQNRVLIGLESGRKLHDLLREPQMPSKAMLEEWRDNPEFDAAYESAAAEGKRKREKVTGKQEPTQEERITPTDRPLPEPLAKPVKRPKPDRTNCPKRGPATKVGTPADLQRIANVQRMSVAIGDADTYIMRGIAGSYCLATQALNPQAESLPAPYEIRLEPIAPVPVKVKSNQQELRRQVLERLRSGVPSATILKDTPGFNGVKLAAWRKEAAFSAEWDEAKATGRGKQPSEPKKVAQEPAKPAPTKSVAAEVALLLPSPSAQESSFYMVAYQGMEHGVGHQFDCLAKAEEVAEMCAKETGKRTYVLKPVMEIIPEVVVVSTSRRVMA